MLARDTSIEAATDDWPFLYMKDRHIPQHYVVALLLILAVSVASVLWVLRGQSGGWSWQFFFLGAGFMLLETKAIIQFALLWGSTWIVASLAIASVLTMALLATFIVSRVEIRRPGVVAAVLVGLLLLNALVPVGRVAIESRAVESLFYAVLMFSPILCAGLLFGSAIKHSTSLARDYGTNLLGAMVGGVAEYLSLTDRLPLPPPGRGRLLYRRRADETAAGRRSSSCGYKIGGRIRSISATCDKKGHNDG